MTATQTTQDFTKTIRPFALTDERTGRPVDVFCRIKYKDGRLSISGVEGPEQNGDAWGSCGQIVGGYAHRDPADNDARTSDPTGPDRMRFARGWDAETWYRFVGVWEAWHLNDMRAGCQHQRAASWDKRPIDPSKPTTAYGKHFPGQRSDSWNLLGWVREDEHPDGLMCRACPECGYRYGTAWLSEPVPEDVLSFLRNLPTADKWAAWV